MAMAKGFILCAALTPFAAAALPADAPLDRAARGLTNGAGEAEPCHKGHCHGAEQCGGPWKDYSELVESTGPPNGAATADEACQAVIDALGEQAKERASTRCLDLHGCAPPEVASTPGVGGKCPETCSGCGVARPFGKVDEADAKRAPRQRGDGKWECTVKGDVLTRCRCAPCLPPKPASP
jgi:hypothetical protein